MKVLYIHQYFRTPEEGGAIRSYYLAKGLVDHGIEVEMISAHNEKRAKTVTVDGIRVHYLPVHYDNRQGFLARLVAFFRFMYLVRRKVRKIKDIDVCYATSTPLTIGLSALRIKKEHKIPYYFEVRDLWPEAPFQMGVIKNKYLKRCLKNLEIKVYKNAEKIIALSPGIKTQIETSEPNKTVALIPNMSDIDFFKPEQKQEALEGLFDVDDKFVVSYFGTIGRANHLDYLLAAANESLKAGLPLQIFIIGDGSELDRLKYLVKHFSISNVRFLPFQSKYNLRRVLNITDAAYVSFASKPIMETNSPNKFFDALAAGKIIITNTKGWVKDIVEGEPCGFYYDPNEPRDFVEKISMYIHSAQFKEESQKRARKVAENQFARGAQVNKLIDILS